MSKIDPEIIKNKTNEIICCELFLRKEAMKKKKFKNFIFVIGIIGLIIGSTFTVNAMTDNKVIEGVKEVLNIKKIKVNGEEKNATCTKLDNGNIECKLDREVLDKGQEVTLEMKEEYKDKIDFEITEDMVSSTINE